MTLNPECSQSEAAKICDSFDRGFKAGVNSVITGGASDSVTHLGQDSVFYAAHELGKRDFQRMSTPFQMQLGLVFIIFLTLFGIAYVLYLK